MIKVTIGGDQQPVFPAECCCCQKAVSPDSTMRLEVPRGGAPGAPAAKPVPIAIPACEECQEHWRATLRADGCLTRLLGPSTMILVMLAMSTQLNKINVNAMSWGQILLLALYFGVALAVFLGVQVGIVALFIRPSTAPPHVRGKEQPVRVQFAPDGTLRMDFAQDGFGARVRDLNPKPAPASAPQDPAVGT